VGVVVVNSGCANLASVVFALQRLGAAVSVSDDVEVIGAADRVILPGVGSAGFAMNELARRGLVDTLKGLKQPTMGICLGMQLLFDSSDEGDVPLLGIIGGSARKFDEDRGLIVPHMGWNDIRHEKDDPLLSGVEDGACFYFVHSYFLPVSDYTLASCEHGARFSAIVRRDNFWGCQFHPERSADAGARILKNFMELT